jgi:hypothetical protein
MRIAMRYIEAQSLAASAYSGSSKPLTQLSTSHDPLKLSWWRDAPRSESFASPRHFGALDLYFKIAANSLIRLPNNSFPSKFDFVDRKSAIPDKGFIKMCLNAELPIIEAHLEKGHLIFQTTTHGIAQLRSYIEFQISEDE